MCADHLISKLAPKEKDPVKQRIHFQCVAQISYNNQNQVDAKSLI